MNHDINISDIGAEMMLNHLYPELAEQWKVRNEGTFYRNYNNDALTVSPESAEISLARDGFLKLLPQGMISPEDELLKGDIQNKHKKIERRKRVLQEAFLPVDSIIFRRKLRVEKETSHLLVNKLGHILKSYFCIDYEDIENPYVKELASLLPFIRNRRSDFGLLKNILASLFDCKVNLYTGRFSETDSTIKWVPLIRYELVINNLDNKEYNNLSNLILPVRDFVAEWFVPAEMKLEIHIKDNNRTATISNKLTLDYNTKIN